MVQNLICNSNTLHYGPNIVLTAPCRHLSPPPPPPPSTPKALSNVPPLRNYFLEEDNYCRIRRPPGDIMFLLVQRFGELMRKLWNPRNFKAHVSPHEMLQAVVLCSKKTFQITKQGTTPNTTVLNAECVYCQISCYLVVVKRCCFSCLI